MKKVNVYGVKIPLNSPRQVAKYLYKKLERGERAIIFTPNFQMLKSARKDIQIASMLNKADLLLPDGIGVSLLCGRRVQRIAGIDAGYALLKYSAAQGKKVFLLGGTPSVAEVAEKKLAAKIPDLHICGTYHGYFDKSIGSDENSAVLKLINDCAPQVVFVCFGFPLQERWILENAPLIPSAKIFMGLGGSLDVWSGNQKRAPLFFRAMGLEWFYRCVRQPKRFISLIRG